jgi:hypothetical protein
MRVRACAIACLLLHAAPLAAQNAARSTASVRGHVTAVETGEALGISTVMLIPGFGRRFTDERGAFSFAGVPPGLYLLSVRQIGYVPLDTQIVVRAGGSPLSIVLRRVAVELPAITVTGRAVCTRPGPPSREVTPALAAVFDQLLENARRLELLADSHPFRFRFERQFVWTNRQGDTTRVEIDTLELQSVETRRAYRPGRVVEEGTGPYRDQRIVLLPSIREFGDSGFLHNHCFRLAGLDTVDGESLVRVDFEPAERLRSSDIGGSAYLDSTYHLRYVDVSLTKPERSRLRGVRAISAQIRFGEVIAGIMLHDQVRAETRYRADAPRRRVEMQRLLSVHFVRPFLPGP